MDKHIIEDFVYSEKSAVARIPSMFYFAEDSKTVNFECSLKLCVLNEECKPNCVLKLDDPIGEDPELVSKILRSSLSDNDEISSSGHLPTPQTRKNIASTLIHVVERREIPTTTIPPSECEYQPHIINRHNIKK